MRGNPLYPDTVTIYNRHLIPQPPFPSQVKYNRTVIKGVMWKDKIHNNQASDGKPFISQTISLTIPAEAEVLEGKTYISPQEYARLIDKAKHWTLTIDSTNPDIIIFGECDAEINELYSVTHLEKDYKTTRIIAVNDSTNQDILPMWKISGV